MLNLKQLLENARRALLRLPQPSGMTPTKFFEWPAATALLVAFFCAAAADPASADGIAQSEPRVAINNPGESVADYLACFRDSDVMLITGHRGGPGPGYPENALETFAYLLAHGPMLIETDVRKTSDGQLVLLHDETLDRTTTGTGPVAEKTLAQIKALKLIDNDGKETSFRIPTLTQALAWARGRAILQLDVKPGVDIERVAAEVATAQAQSFAVVIAYSLADAMTVAAVDKNLTISAEIVDTQQLDKLTAAGIREDRIMAWTGVEARRPDLWRALNRRGVSTAWGSFWLLDEDVREGGNPIEFVRLAKGPLDVLSTDLPMIAYDAVMRVQNVEAAAKDCNKQPPVVVRTGTR